VSFDSFLSFCCAIINRSLIGVSILAELWNAPSSRNAIGTATTGSSEAIQLGGLAMKRIWQEKRKAAGKSIHEPGPNIIMGANAQVALEKFARYFDVEMRLVPISVESKYHLDAKKAMEYVDENTIGIFVILGSMHRNFCCNSWSYSRPLEVLTLATTNPSRRWRIFWMNMKQKQATLSQSTVCTSIHALDTA